MTTDDLGWTPIPDEPAEVAEAYVGTCDAGDCDAITSAVVLTREGGWLSMCAGHTVVEFTADSGPHGFPLPMLGMRDLN